MKYYTLVVVEYNDGKADKKAIYEHESDSLAIANYHSEMGKYMKDSTVSHVLVIPFNSEDGRYSTDTVWSNPIQPTVEVEEVADVTEEVTEE